MPNGWIITVLVLIPNLLVVVFPPREIPPELTAKKPWYLEIAEVLERIGQIGCFGIPFFYPLRTSASMDKILLGLAGVALLFYYAGWLRYGLRKSKFRMLFSPLMSVPIPMAVAPVIVFFLAALNLHSWPLAIASVVLAAGHLPVSWHSWKRCQSVEI